MSLIVDTTAPPWAHDLGMQLDRALIDARRITLSTVANLPSPLRNAGLMVGVLPSCRPAYSDGVIWRFVSDDTPV